MIVSNSSFTNNSATDGADIHGRVGTSRPAVYSISECTFSGTAEDIRNDNTASITVANSGSPNTSGAVTFTNTTTASTSPVTNCPSTPTPCFSVLPVTFIDFWAGCDTEENIELYWETESELNNERFTIERAADDLNFEEIGYVLGAGTSLTNSEYSFIDRNALMTRYYRLSQIDFDVSRTFLKTIFATTCKARNNIYAHQFNNTTSELEIFYNSDKKENVDILLVDAAGSVITQSKNVLSPDSQNLKIAIHKQLEPGIYLVYVAAKSETYQGKMLVVNN